MVVDAKSDKVFYYQNAATLTSGTANATSSFALDNGNKGAKDLVTDGTSLWVVNDSTTDKVFKYNLSGMLQGSWTINSANSSPTGITIDPSNVSQDIWIVDNGTDRVYRYANGRTLAAPTLTDSFALAPGNTNPQGIADPSLASLSPTSGSQPSEPIPVASASDDDVRSHNALGTISPPPALATVRRNLVNENRPAIAVLDIVFAAFDDRLGNG